MKIQVVLILIIVVLAGLLSLSVYLYYNQPRPEQRTEVTVHRVSYPVETRIVEKSVPAVIDTVYIDNQEHVIAKYKERLERDRTTVDLDVAYDERVREFSVDAHIVSVVDSVYVEKEVVKVVERKAKFVGLMSGVFVGANRNEDGGVRLASVGLDVGVKFVGKYSVSAFVMTDKTFGVRLGLDF